MNNLFAIIVFISLIAIIVFAILTIVNFIKDKNKVSKTLKRLGISFGTFVLFFILFGVTMDESEVAAKKDEKVETSAPVKEETAEEKKAREAKVAEEKSVAEQKAKEKKEAEAKAKEEKVAKEKAEADAKAKEEANKTPLQKVEEIIIDKLGKKNNMDNDKISSMEDISEAQDGSYIIARLNADENLTNNLTKKGMWYDSIDVFEPISKLETTNKIVLQWQLPLTDAYGETEDGVVMTIDLERDQLDKIKWDNFNGKNFEVISNNYFLHPALK